MKYIPAIVLRTRASAKSRQQDRSTVVHLSVPLLPLPRTRHNNYVCKQSRNRANTGPAQLFRKRAGSDNGEIGEEIGPGALTLKSPNPPSSSLSSDMLSRDPEPEEQNRNMMTVDSACVVTTHDTSDLPHPTGQWHSALFLNLIDHAKDHDSLCILIKGVGILAWSCNAC